MFRKLMPVAVTAAIGLAAFMLGRASAIPAVADVRINSSSDETPAGGLTNLSDATSARETTGAAIEADAGTHRVIVEDGGLGSTAPGVGARAAIAQIGRFVEATERFRPADGMEAIAGSMEQFLDGWIHAVLELAPTSLPALNASVEHTLCDPATSDAQLMVLVRLSTRVPELASSEGYDCVLRRHNDEDALLAGVLDGYRQARLAPSEAWTAWRARATREVIVRRFAPPGEEFAGRGKTGSPPVPGRSRGGTR